jgi:hypothetical protein
MAILKKARHCEAPPLPGNGLPAKRERGLALDDSQIMPPVVDRSCRQVMGPLDQPVMLAQEFALCDHHDPFWVDPQAEGEVREGC